MYIPYLLIGKGDGFHFFVKDLKTKFVVPVVTCSKGVPSSGIANYFIMLLVFKQDTELFASLKYVVSWRFQLVFFLKKYTIIIAFRVNEYVNNLKNRVYVEYF